MEEIVIFIRKIHSEDFGVVKLIAKECFECDTNIIADPIKENKKKHIIANPYHALINGNGIVGTRGKYGNCLSKKAILIETPFDQA
ncbi:MAG: hypothetical protein MUP85_24245 [Candidatus Lokiarchaeota archaeon]|nr:hypothetical protein [Candidatus Lokiarchaeota archaeon]